ncbi:hypothetical protein SB5439_04743 [Klebsiella variicola]|uniref:TfoX/Sxy family protein n=1 Tax=Enterobacteriaceae TaxID=543 RepID=UPI00069A0217|nr:MULTISPECIES: TfoX/Sxy family protein [Enterobacteriaceae]VGQ09616.1 hypothetical protein SB5439_04743 [Klebsiella variicola]
MATRMRQSSELAGYYVDELSGWARVTTRPLFGAIALYRENQIFAMVWKGALYFKVDSISRRDYEAAGSHPLGYEGKNDEHALKTYWEVPADVTEDNGTLLEWAQRAWNAACCAGKGR